MPKVSPQQIVNAVLFDADGVTQRSGKDWRSSFLSVLGSDRAEHLDEFISAIFDAERPFLTNSEDFRGELIRILSDWGCYSRLDQLLSVWTSIDLYAEVIQEIGMLRGSGICCYIASNQESFRAAHMSHALGYKNIFDDEFYSCNIGYAKPDSEFFRLIIESLGLPPEKIGFLDDNEPNVFAAREAGMKGATYQGTSGTGELWRRFSMFGIVRTFC
jgi:HAD superfamily hydrolase (TIGR01509 family)